MMFEKPLFNAHGNATAITGSQALPSLGTGDELFRHWLSKRSQDTRDRLSPSAAKPYAYIWASWCRWLAKQETSAEAPSRSWRDATAQDVADFLTHGPSPSSSRKPRTSPVSDITRRRYWRVLDALYRHAKNNGDIEASPTELMPSGPPPTEKPEGQVFQSNQWAALRNSLPEAISSWDFRDRAILCLLMDAALTTEEICRLQIHQVADSLFVPGRVALQVTGKRKAQERNLELELTTSVAVRRWLEVRASLHLHHAHIKDSPVFVSQKGRPMSPRAVFHLVAGFVRRAFALHHIELPNHIGAQVLRNTRIVMWLNQGMLVHEVVYRAGFKNAKSFRGLQRHLVPPKPIQPTSS